MRNWHQRRPDETFVVLWTAAGRRRVVNPNIGWGSWRPFLIISIRRGSFFDNKYIYIYNIYRYIININHSASTTLDPCVVQPQVHETMKRLRQSALKKSSYREVRGAAYAELLGDDAAAETCPKLDWDRFDNAQFMALAQIPTIRHGRYWEVYKCLLEYILTFFATSKTGGGSPCAQGNGLAAMDLRSQWSWGCTPICRCHPLPGQGLA